MKTSFFRTSTALLAAAFILCGGRQISAIHRVNAADAEKLIKDVGVVLIDVRTPDEYAKGFIPGATLIPLNELPKRLKELPSDKTQPILLYCRNGGRSTEAARLLLQSGRKDLYLLTGGMQTWVAAQKPLQIPKP